MESAIEVEGLVKHFAQVHAVDGVSFDVAPGTVFGLLGPNGSGKTTIVRILSTILRPDAGSARVLGRDVVHRADEVRYLIGLAGQFAAIDPNLTGAENLRLTGRLAQLPGKVARTAPTTCSTGSSCGTPPTARPGPTRVVCGGASTWRRPSCNGPRSCSSTSRRPDSTSTAATSSGT